MRQTWPDLWMHVAQEVAKMSTCIRREVGCVLVDESNHVLATGVNGVPPGFRHCDPNKSAYPSGDEVRTCPGAAELPPGLSDSPVQGVTCLANHSEINALLHCDAQRVHTCYVTLSPCVSCVKALLCTSALNIVFFDEYSNLEAKALWTEYAYIRHGRGHPEYTERKWIRYKLGLRLER